LQAGLHFAYPAFYVWFNTFLSLKNT